MTLPRYSFVIVGLLYLVATLLLGYQAPGLQYDEAIFYLASVGHTPEPAKSLGAFPLMVMPYAGALKDAVLMPFVAYLPPGVAYLRAVSVALTLAGLWGMLWGLQRVWSARLALISMSLLALHPSFVLMTLYDCSVAPWMACFGLLCAALGLCFQRQTWWSFALLGLTSGLLVWTRTNALWLLLAGVLAALLTNRKWIVLLARNTVAFGTGFLLGCAPLLVYLSKSWDQFVQAAKDTQMSATLWQLVTYRAWLFADVLLWDGQHRVIFGAEPVPSWLGWIASLLVFGCLGYAWIKGPEWLRWVGLSALFYGLIMLPSTFPIAEHHYVTLLPMAVWVCVFALQKVRIWAAVYVVFALSSLIWSGVEMRRTGGVGAWSDALNRVTERLEKQGFGEVAVADWGIAAPVSVLSKGKVQTRELFWGANEQQSASGERWSSVLGKYRAVLLWADKAYFPAAKGIAQELESTGMQAIRVPQRDGTKGVVLWVRR